MLPSRNGSASSSPLTATMSMIGFDSSAATRTAVHTVARGPLTVPATAAARSTVTPATSAPSTRSAVTPPSASTALKTAISGGGRSTQ